MIKNFNGSYGGWDTLYVANKVFKQGRSELFFKINKINTDGSGLVMG